MTAAGAALASPPAGSPCVLVSISGDIETARVGTDPMSRSFVHGMISQVLLVRIINGTSRPRTDPDEDFRPWLPDRGRERVETGSLTGGVDHVGI